MKLMQQTHADSLDALCANWLTKCEAKLNANLRRKNFLKQTLQDCHLVLHDINLVKRLEKFTIYVAYDSDQHIQGVAFTEKDRLHNATHITYLTTSPDNIPIFPGEKKIQGVGTLLLLHIIQDMFQAQRKGITVKSLPSAIGFYEKCGFILKKSHLVKRKATKKSAAQSVVLSDMDISIEGALQFMEKHQQERFSLNKSTSDLKVL